MVRRGQSRVIRNTRRRAHCRLASCFNGGFYSYNGNQNDGSPACQLKMAERKNISLQPTKRPVNLVGTVIVGKALVPSITNKKRLDPWY